MHSLAEPNMQVDVVVAGHICLDLIPKLGEEYAHVGNLVQPGRLVQTGPASVSLGGCVGNTGLALHRLGAKTRLIGKVGDDPLGNLLSDSLVQHGPNLNEGMVVAPGEATSYSIVINPPGVDRSFLHCSGANDTFSAHDLAPSAFAEARILHFGYPPLMKEIMADGGNALASVLQTAQSQGVLTSLDLAMPAAGKPSVVNWKAWLTTVLPAVDLFVPSLDEILLMLDPDAFRRADEAAQGENLASVIEIGLLEELAADLGGMGASIILIKLGDEGLYLRTDEDTTAILSNRLNSGQTNWQRWSNLQMICPCFDVDVEGTTGAGDCTIAGFLMAILAGYDPERALQAATAVGAFCVQSADATSGIPVWTAIESMVQGSHPQKAPTLSLESWSRCRDTGVFSPAPDRHS